MIQTIPLQSISRCASYAAILSNVGLQMLKERRDCSCKNYFNNIRANTHKLHYLLPGERHVNYEMRQTNLYIAHTSVLSTVLATARLFKLESVFETSVYQFGFKSHHSTDLCIHTLTEIVEYYKSHSTSVYMCFMDASKTFDRVNHWTLFKPNDRQ